MANIHPTLVADDIFSITPDDDADIIEDAGNGAGYYHCYVHNTHTAQAIVKVTTARGVSDTVMINSGDIFPLAVRRVWSTGTDAAVLTLLKGLVGHQR